MLFLLLTIIVATCEENLASAINEIENYNYVEYEDYMILNDGNVIPKIAFGTFTPYRSIRESSKIEQSIIWAIEAGYRLIDTAPVYYAEDDIARAIRNVTKRGIVTREDLFITTQIDVRVNDTDGVIKSLQKSLKRLMLNYVDLFLIQVAVTPDGRAYDTLALWRGMEEAKKMGLAMSIGVSNFNSSNINKILAYGNIRPAVNQIEESPTYTQLELTAYCLSQGIAVMSFAPYGTMVPRPLGNKTPPPIFNDPTLKNIAAKYGKTANQVVLRYLVDRGTIPIPQSINKRHIEENIDIFDFHLSREDVYLINELNKNEQVYSDNYQFIKQIASYTYGCNSTTVDEIFNCAFKDL